MDVSNDFHTAFEVELEGFNITGELKASYEGDHWGCTMASSYQGAGFEVEDLKIESVTIGPVEVLEVSNDFDEVMANAINASTKACDQFLSGQSISIELKWDDLYAYGTGLSAFLHTCPPPAQSAHCSHSQPDTVPPVPEQPCCLDSDEFSSAPQKGKTPRPSLNSIQEVRLGAARNDVRHSVEVITSLIPVVGCTGTGVQNIRQQLQVIRVVYNLIPDLRKSLEDIERLLQLRLPQTERSGHRNDRTPQN